MRSSPPVTPASAMKLADLDVVGRDGVLAAPEPVDAADLHDVGADALDRRAHAYEHPREVLDVGLGRGVADDRRCPASARPP